MKIALVACLALMACCHSPKDGHQMPQECVSKCGLLFQGFDNGGMNCEQLQEAEDVMLDLYGKSQACKDDPRFCEPMSCAMLFGWQIRSEDAYAWTVDGRDFAIGVSDCNSKVMTVGQADDWRHGSFPHEIAHVIQGCYPMPDWTETFSEAMRGGGHAGWGEHGVDDVIKMVRGQ